MSSHETFADKLARSQEDAESLLCIGLDPDPDRLPTILETSTDVIEAVRLFCTEIIEATARYACAFKVNFAFFEALGPVGWQLLKVVSDSIPPSKVRIADAKRGDIGNSGRFYARAVFEQLAFDACTVSPYMGKSSVLPFLQYRDKAAIVLARTSNPDADEVQLWPDAEKPLFRHVATCVREWAADQPGTAGLVVGATDLESLRELWLDCSDMPFLVPGVGAQGGDVREVVDLVDNVRGRLMVSSSRSILYASEGPDFADAAGRSAALLRDRIRAAVASERKAPLR